MPGGFAISRIDLVTEGPLAGTDAETFGPFLSRAPAVPKFTAMNWAPAVIHQPALPLFFIRYDNRLHLAALKLGTCRSPLHSLKL
jgi:hypothetical protein